MNSRSWCLAALSLLAAAAQQPRHKETVDVSRLLVDVRVIESGRPVLGLGSADFAVRIDGKPARIDSVQWVGGLHDASDTELEHSSAATSPAAATGQTADGAAARTRGRLIVFLVQKDLESSRITGLMRAATETPAFLTGFTPDDRLAVLSFDTRLKVWLDFTSDIEEVRRVLQRGVLVERPGAVRPSTFPSLLDRLPPSLASKTWTIEDALAALGDALAPLPGPKTVVLLGYGFGRLTGGRNMSSWTVMMAPGYERARGALQAARASVFCLDITTADYHSLEEGLRMVAEDTGGFFVRTHIFTRQAFDRLAAALTGHYVLFVEKPDVRRGTHRIDVRLVRHGGDVFARRQYVDP